MARRAMPRCTRPHQRRRPTCKRGEQEPDQGRSWDRGMLLRRRRFRRAVRSLRSCSRVRGATINRAKQAIVGRDEQHSIDADVAKRRAERPVTAVVRAEWCTILYCGAVGPGGAIVRGAELRATAFVRRSTEVVGSTEWGLSKRGRKRQACELEKADDSLGPADAVVSVHEEPFSMCPWAYSDVCIAPNS
jgi:hypothetical protein